MVRLVPRRTRNNENQFEASSPERRTGVSVLDGSAKLTLILRALEP